MNNNTKKSTTTIDVNDILDILAQNNFSNDLSKICKLIARITGNSYRKIYNELQKGICFSEFHNKEIEEVNKIFSELNLSISISKDKFY